MSNPQHLAILKQGLKAWNEWRQENPDVEPDLKGAVINWDLSGVDLSRCDLTGAGFYETDVISANLRNAKLMNSEFFWVDLTESDLTGVDLSYAALSEMDSLDRADFSHAKFSFSRLQGVDLSKVRGLDKVRHEGPSSIDIDTVYLSKGNISEVFLRGAGVPDDFIRHMKSLVGHQIQFYSCFISYSSKDQEFADQLYTDLQKEGVRCWFARKSLKTGDEFRTEIDKSIRVHDKLLLVLSENSIDSKWVQKEVETAFEKEQHQNTLVLFPVRLDNSVMERDKAWAADIRRMRQIADFSNWKDHDSYEKAFQRLLSDLKTEKAEGKTA